MARTTVEDCVKHCENHFELVLGVVARSRRLIKGETSELPQNSDGVIVQSLREISQGNYVVDFNAEIERSLAEDKALTAGSQNVATEANADEELSPET